MSKFCFYVPGNTTIQDGAIEVAPGCFIGQYSGESLETMAERVPGVTLCEFDKALAEMKTAREARYCLPPVEITAEQYRDWLECLPPCRWTRERGAESFFISEPLDADLHQWCVRIGNRHFALTRSRFAKTADIVAECVA